MKQSREEIQNAGKMFCEHAECKREQRKKELKATIRNCGAFLLGMLFAKLLRLLLGGG